MGYLEAHEYGVICDQENGQSEGWVRITNHFYKEFMKEEFCKIMNIKFDKGFFQNAILSPNCLSPSV